MIVVSVHPALKARPPARPPSSAPPQQVTPAGENKQRGRNRRKAYGLQFQLFQFWAPISNNELLDLVQNGTSSFILGSSGTFSRCLSRACLNVSIEQLVIFRIWFGIELNNLGPFTVRLANRRVCILHGADVFMWGTRQDLPCLLLSTVVTPKFGTRPSSAFQIYIMAYLSRLL